MRSLKFIIGVNITLFQLFFTLSLIIRAGEKKAMEELEKDSIKFFNNWIKETEEQAGKFMENINKECEEAENLKEKQRALRLNKEQNKLSSFSILKKIDLNKEKETLDVKGEENLKKIRQNRKILLLIRERTDMIKKDVKFFRKISAEEGPSVLSDWLTNLKKKKTELDNKFCEEERKYDELQRGQHEKIKKIDTKARYWKNFFSSLPLLYILFSTLFIGRFCWANFFIKGKKLNKKVEKKIKRRMSWMFKRGGLQSICSEVGYEWAKLGDKEKKVVQNMIIAGSIANKPFPEIIQEVQSFLLKRS